MLTSRPLNRKSQNSKLNRLLFAALLATLAIVSCHKHKDAPDARSHAQPLASNTGRAGPASNPPCVNLNTATTAELAALPVIGEVLAARIIEYRGRHGAFQRAQDIIIVDGMSERRYRKLEGLVCVD